MQAQIIPFPKQKIINYEKLEEAINMLGGCPCQECKKLKHDLETNPAVRREWFGEEGKDAIS